MLELDKDKVLLAMANKCFSIRQMAKVGSMSCATLTKITKSGGSYSPSVVGKLAKVLGVPAESLVKA